MARTPTGQILKRRGKRGTVYALRFRALGERRYLTLGPESRPRRRPTRRWRPYSLRFALRSGDRKWLLTHHLLPFFKSHRLSEITVREILRYKTVKLAEGTLSPNTLKQDADEALADPLARGRVRPQGGG